MSVIFPSFQLIDYLIILFSLQASNFPTEINIPCIAAKSQIDLFKALIFFQDFSAHWEVLYWCFIGLQHDHIDTVKKIPNCVIPLDQRTVTLESLLCVNSFTTILYRPCLLNKVMHSTRELLSMYTSQSQMLEKKTISRSNRIFLLGPIRLVTQ